MYEEETNYLKSVSCFICLKVVKQKNQKMFGTLVHCDGMDVFATFIVCPDDHEWIAKNKDAARAIVTARLMPPENK
jgi:hypothetical protein